MIRLIRTSTLRRMEKESAQRSAYCETLREQLWQARNATVAIEAQLEAAQAALSVETDRSDSLMKQIIELKREGFNPAPPPAVYERTDAALPAPIAGVLNDLAGHGTALYYDLLAEANALLATDTPHEEVIKSLRTGSTWNPLNS